MLVHATCVALNGKAAILRGPPGAGKSDLALRFLFLPVSAAGGQPCFVADDQTELARVGEIVIARPPATIAGKLEVRGVSIVDVQNVSEAELTLVVDLVAASAVPRLPDDETESILGLPVRRLRLDPWPASAAIKLAVALNTW
jgi:serine kinase of HPr protein (carbohydrate metabolism regulator)